MNETFQEWEKQVQGAIEVLENPESYELEHQGNNGNKGLANFLAYAAVTERDGELQVLEEYEQLFEQSGSEKRYRNIADRLVENEVDGRERLEEMLASARTEQLSQLDDEHGDKDCVKFDTTPVSKSGKEQPVPNGGEKRMTDDYDSFDEVVAAAERGQFDSFEDYREAANKYLDGEMTVAQKTKYERATRSMLTDESVEKLEHWGRLSQQMDLTEGEVSALLDAVDDLREQAEEGMEDYRELYTTIVGRALENDIAVGERLENLNDHMDEGIEQQQELREDVRDADADPTDRFEELERELEEARAAVPGLEPGADEETEE